MALQMATNITPDVFSGIGGDIFDANAGLTVSWQVNGTSPMIAYKIVIQQYDANSTQLYTTGKVNLSTPFYGISYKGQVQFFQAQTIPASALAGAGVSNGKSYKMVITQWWGNSDDQSVTQNSAAIISAWSGAVLTMNPIPNPMPSRKYSFTASFSQAQGDTINWIRWQVAQGGSDNILYDTGNIYGTSQIQMDYDSFFTGENYMVQCTVQTQAGQEASTGWVSFSVEYAVAQPDGVLNAQIVCGTKGVNINWSSARNNVGYVNGNYEIVDNTLSLYPNSEAIWDTENDMPISYAPPYSFAWMGKLGMNQMKVFELTTDAGNAYLEIAIGTSSTTVTFTANGTAYTQTISGQLYASRWWNVIGTANNIYITYFEFTGGLYPSQTLYPSTSLYPQESTGIEVAKNAQIAADSWQTGTIEKITLYGSQTTEYFWIVQGDFDNEAMSEMQTNGAYQPTWGNGTLFLATFADGLNAGNLETNGYTLYRRNLMTGEYKHLLDLGISTLSVFDYGARNQHDYEYQLYYADDNIYTASPMTSRILRPCLWDWVLCACTEDSDGIFHVQKVFSFGCNVESGNIGNNNSPTTQKTFTRYPNYQPDTSNYQSGTLKALIGKIDPLTNTYMDSVELEEDLKALSISDYTLFLKDRKGNMYMVRTGSAIQTIVSDTYPNQAVTIQLPWVEIGDASEAVVVAVPGDGGYIENIIREAR